MKEILKAEELLQDETFEKILSIENDIEQVKEVNRIRDIAKSLSMLKNFNDILAIKRAAAKQKNKFAERTRNRDWYYINDHGETSFKPAVLSENIIKNHLIIFAGGNYYSFINGVYKNILVQELGKITASYLDDNYAPSQIENTRYVINNYSIISPDDLNNRTDVINSKSGILKLDGDSVKVHKHTPKLLSTIQINAKHDVTTTCPQFINFLNVAIKNENIPLLQEFCGYLLIPATFAQKAFVLLGKGGCGKSTILRIMTHLLGSENISNIPLQSVNERFKTAELYGKIANFFADLPEKEIDDTGIFKALTGEDTVTAERKGQNPFKFVNKARFLFSCNKLPRSTSDRTDAFYRRLIILPFNDPIPEEQRDLELTDKLLTEVDGIFLWALEGLKRLKANRWRFSETEDSKKAINKYRAENNNVIPFVEECCVIESSEIISSDELYRTYTKYCEDNGYKPFGAGRFKDEMESEFQIFKVKKRPDGSNRKVSPRWVFTGISLNPFE